MFTLWKYVRILKCIVFCRLWSMGSVHGFWDMVIECILSESEGKMIHSLFSVDLLFHAWTVLKMWLQYWTMLVSDWGNKWGNFCVVLHKVFYEIESKVDSLADLVSASVVWVSAFRNCVRVKILCVSRIWMSLQVIQHYSRDTRCLDNCWCS